MSFRVRESLKEAIPWFVKIPAKVVLSRLPVSTQTWQKINIFRAGAANVPEFYFDVFNSHLKAGNAGSIQGKTVLEIGPGNALLTALWTVTLGDPTPGWWIRKTWRNRTAAYSLRQRSSYDSGA